MSHALVARMSARSACSTCELVGDRLFTDVPEVYWFTLPKMLAALRWAASGGRPSFDFVFRTNTSSYVDISKLQAVSRRMPSTGCYAGYVGTRPVDGSPYVSGAGVLLSWDVVCEVASSSGPWSWGVTDDLALGEHLRTVGIAPIPLPRVSVDSVAAVQALSEDELGAAFHFRCRSDDKDRADAAIMAAVHERIRALAMSRTNNSVSRPQ
jgi:hypothetical protein